MERVPRELPISLSMEWRRRSWTTNPPKYEPHFQWSVSLRISAEEPLRVALVRGNDIKKLMERSSNPSLGILWLMDNAEPTAVEQRDPWSALGVVKPTQSATWELIPVIAARDNAPGTALIAVPRRDTELLRRGCWRIRRELWPYLSGTLLQLRTWRGNPPSVPKVAQ